MHQISNGTKGPLYALSILKMFCGLRRDFPERLWDRDIGTDFELGETLFQKLVLSH